MRSRLIETVSRLIIPIAPWPVAPARTHDVVIKRHDDRVFDGRAQRTAASSCRRVSTGTGWRQESASKRAALITASLPRCAVGIWTDALGLSSQSPEERSAPRETERTARQAMSLLGQVRKFQVRKSEAGLRRFRFAIDARSSASARFDCADY